MLSVVESFKIPCTLCVRLSPLAVPRKRGSRSPGPGSRFPNFPASRRRSSVSKIPPGGGDQESKGTRYRPGGFIVDANGNQGDLVPRRITDLTLDVVVQSASTFVTVFFDWPILWIRDQDRGPRRSQTVIKRDLTDMENAASCSDLLELRRIISTGNILAG